MLARMPDHLTVNEIYLSVQGESTFAGLPCVLIRLTGCNLRCSYCDTAYAFRQGRRRTLEDIRPRSAVWRRPIAPFAAGLDSLGRVNGRRTASAAGIAAAARSVVRRDGFTVLLETSGALDIAPVDRVRRVMDIKCPSSGESAQNRWENLTHLRATDEVKFVIGTEQDYRWARRSSSRAPPR